MRAESTSGIPHGGGESILHHEISSLACFRDTAVYLRWRHAVDLSNLFDVCCPTHARLPYSVFSDLSSSSLT